MISGLNDFLSASSFSSAFKCPECADAVGYSLMIIVPCVFFDRFVTFFSKICCGKFIMSCIGILSQLASILSAIFSSAISRVMYKTFLPCKRVEAAR